MDVPVRCVAPIRADATEAEILPCGSCLRCVRACPTGALQYRRRMWSLDLGRCIFCRGCASICPNSLIGCASA